MKPSSLFPKLPVIRCAALVAFFSISCALPAISSPAKATHAAVNQPRALIVEHQLDIHRSITAGQRIGVVSFNVPTFYGQSLVTPMGDSPANQSYGYANGTHQLSKDNYLGQMGGESRWARAKCIRVYVAPGRKSFPGIIAECFNQWSAASDHRFTWCFVNDASGADYSVSWTKHTHSSTAGDEAGLTTTETAAYPNCDTAVIEKARTRILTRYEGQELSDTEIAKTALHELGHGLGLEGHSSNPRDIMYYAVSPKQRPLLTVRDANTIARLYGTN